MDDDVQAVAEHLRKQGRTLCAFDEKLKITIHKFSPGQRICSCGEVNTPISQSRYKSNVFVRSGF